jgi:hypothetical protein
MVPQMNITPPSDYPRLCVEVGLDCETCVTSTAQELASACKGLRGKMVGQMFVQLYPDPACSRMHAHFGEAYRVANSRVGGAELGVDPNVEVETIPRRKPQPERRRVMVAVA